MEDAPKSKPWLADVPVYSLGRPREEVRKQFPGTLYLSDNENPMGPSPLALLAMEKNVWQAASYPDGDATYLKEALALHWRLEPAQIIVGCGSDELIKLLGEVYLSPGDEAVMADPAFSQYAFSALLQGAKAVKVPLNAQSRHDLPAILAAVGPLTKMIFICNPHNPTGSIVDAQELDDFIAKVPPRVLVVIDAAYGEFAQSPLYSFGHQHVRRPNVIVLHTFSKIYGLAGLRIGYGLADASLIASLEKAKPPYNVTDLSLAAARAALSDHAYVEKCKNLNEQGKEQLYAGLAGLGLEYLPTEANFILLRAPRPAAEVAAGLAARGIMVRDCTSFNLPHHIRVTVGRKDDNSRFLAALQEVLQSV